MIRTTQFFIIDTYKCFMNSDVANPLDIADESNSILTAPVPVTSYQDLQIFLRIKMKIRSNILVRTIIYLKAITGK